MFQFESFDQVKIQINHFHVIRDARKIGNKQ